MRKKLIEVALPLEAINRESAREKSIRHGHPSTLHLWWARRPLAACRAVLFASIVDDPSSRPEEFPTDDAQQVERERLFRIIEELIKWDNSNDARVLGVAQEEIRRATDGHPPRVLDPFCGGGSIPLEAQRLGMDAHASDLNPVAVMITKAMVEIPPRFAGQPPMNPHSRSQLHFADGWSGAKGMAEDVRYYGRWMREEAERRVGHLYPKVRLPGDQGGGEATVIAWLWARTVVCPNPACGARMPLISTLWLSKKKGRTIWLRPVVSGSTVLFEVVVNQSEPPAPPKRGQGANFVCLACDTPAHRDHVHDEFEARRDGAQLLATVADGGRSRGRIYLPADLDHISAATVARPIDVPDQECRGTFGGNAQGRRYGFQTFGDYFTSRQLVAITTYSDLLPQARELALRDAIATGRPNDGVMLSAGGTGAQAYADAITVYLALALDKMTDTNSSLCSWQIDPPRLRATFGRQALPMVWDYAETNPFAGAAGDFNGTVGSLCEVLDRLPEGAPGLVKQLDATSAINCVVTPLIATDPPYYDNIGYADLADFFYIWLRRSLASIYPDLFSTLLTPKEHELIASPYRFGGSRDKAEQFFEDGLGQAFRRMRAAQHDEYPLTLFYAFKQAEGDDGNGNLTSTGWETMLGGLLAAGFSVTGTWPMRSELSTRNVSLGANALASSIVLACRPRPSTASLATRREFVGALKAELPSALKKLQHGNIAPVDLAQAAIGPGMAVFSRYVQVIEADGSQMRIRTALVLINQVLDELLTEQETEYDAATRWALAWFEQFGMAEATYGDAETLAKAKNIAVAGLVEDGLLRARGGKVRLLTRDELRSGWDPTIGSQLTVWEVTQHLMRVLDADGEEAAAAILRKLGAGYGETARDLAYRLFRTCERKDWQQEAFAYNSLVISWSEISRLAGREPKPSQAGFF